MVAQDRERIFERLVRLDNVDSTAGPGSWTRSPIARGIAMCTRRELVVLGTAVGKRRDLRTAAPGRSLKMC